MPGYRLKRHASYKRVAVRWRKRDSRRAAQAHRAAADVSISLATVAHAHKLFNSYGANARSSSNSISSRNSSRVSRSFIHQHRRHRLAHPHRQRNIGGATRVTSSSRSRATSSLTHHRIGTSPPRAYPSRVSRGAACNNWRPQATPARHLGGASLSWHLGANRIAYNSCVKQHPWRWRRSIARHIRRVGAERRLSSGWRALIARLLAAAPSRHQTARIIVASWYLKVRRRSSRRKRKTRHLISSRRASLALMHHLHQQTKHHHSPAAGIIVSWRSRRSALAHPLAASRPASLFRL